MRFGTDNYFGTSSPFGCSPGLLREVYQAYARKQALAQDKIGGNTDILIDIIAGIMADWTETAIELREMYDIDAATGYWLEVIGRILNQPRWGLSDVDYRKLLKIRGLLVLRSTGSAETLIAIADKWAGGDVLYVPRPPYDFEISVPDLELEDVEIVGRVMTASLIAAVKGSLLYGGFEWGNTHDPEFSAPWGNTHDVLFEQLWGTVTEI